MTEQEQRWCAKGGFDMTKLGELLYVIQRNCYDEDFIRRLLTRALTLESVLGKRRAGT